MVEQPTDMKKQTPKSTTGLESNVAGLLCYLCLPLTGIAFLLVEKNDETVKFHAWQATLLGLAWIAVIVSLKLVATILGAIIAILGVLIGFFVPIVTLLMLLLWVVCIIKAYQGERWKIPVIGDFAAQKAGV